MTLDFFVKEEFRGKRASWPSEQGGQRLVISIPATAAYLDVNPLEDEEECQGDQGSTYRQQLLFYDESKNPIGTQDLDGIICTSELMFRLENVFQKQY